VQLFVVIIDNKNANSMADKTGSRSCMPMHFCSQFSIFLVEEEGGKLVEERITNAYLIRLQICIESGLQ